MYDSDEVRDTLRCDALAWMRREGGFRPTADLPFTEQTVVLDALAAAGSPWEQPVREYLREMVFWPQEVALKQLAEALYTRFKQMAEKMLDAMKPLLDRLREVVEAVLGKLHDFAEAVGAVEAREPPPFVWQQRSRRPDVLPVHSVDAVVAGRSPSAWFRTRIRGGRR